jgi:hypothetical protein
VPTAVATGFPQADHVKLLAVMLPVTQITSTTTGRTCGLPPQSAIVVAAGTAPDVAGLLHAVRSNSGSARAATAAARVVLPSTALSFLLLVTFLVVTFNISSEVTHLRLLRSHHMSANLR